MRIATHKTKNEENKPPHLDWCDELCSDITIKLWPTYPGYQDVTVDSFDLSKSYSHVTNKTSINFPVCQSYSATITHVSVFDQNGERLYSGRLDWPVLVTEGTNPIFGPDSLKLDII